MSGLQEERSKFEEWVKEPGHPEGGYKLDKTASGAYINPETRCAWRGWLGCAQLTAAAPGAVPVGVIVGNDPVHGWHMRALVDWEAIGEGTKLYAAPVAAAAPGADK